MKIPKFIKVGGHTYEVVFAEGLWMRDGLVGQARHYTEQTLEVEAALCPEGIGLSFVHETLHAIDRIYNNHALSEDAVDALAEGLFQVLSDMGITFER